MIKSLVQSALGRFGYKLVRRHGHVESSLPQLFIALRNLGFRPAHIVDVGANIGGWTRHALEFFPDCAFTLVEPQAGFERHVADLVGAGHRLRWVHAGVADRSGVMRLSVVPDQHVSSTFRLSPEEAARQGLPQVEVPVRTLDEIVAEAGQPLPDLVKIDAEGFDLKVLAGASTLVGKTDVFLMEAAVCCREIENTLLANTRAMADLGYRAFDILDLNRTRRQGLLWLCEVAYLRENSPLWDRVEGY